jgi:hypothetical protein
MNIPPIGHANAAPIMAGISANSIFPIPIGIPPYTKDRNFVLFLGLGLSVSKQLSLVLN